MAFINLPTQNRINVTNPTFINPPAPINVYKVALFGNCGSGKTNYTRRLSGLPFDEKHLATMGVEVNPIHFHTNIGLITINMWDTAGKGKFGGLREGYYVKCDAGIYMHDLSTPYNVGTELDYASKFINTAKDNAPIICIGNKSDKEIEGCNYNYKISVKESSIDELRTPLLHLLTQLTGIDIDINQ